MLNKRKRVLIAITFTIIMIILTATTNIIEQYKSNENMILAVVWALTKNYKIRQIILIVAIFLYGKILLIKMSNLRSTLLQNFLALPIGISVGIIVSYVILFLNIPYVRWTVISLVILILVFAIFKGKERIEKHDIFETIEAMFYVVGLSCFATSGLPFLHLTEDSYYFISQYGQIIVNCAGLNADYCSKYMMWTGIGPALINSLAIMAGFETIYGIHHMLIISFVGIFVYSVYENILQIYNVKKTIFYSLILGLLLIITPAVGITLGLELSSTYFMIYIFIIVYLVIKQINNDQNAELGWIPALMVCTTVLLRQEASIVLCYFIIMLSTFKNCKKILLHNFMLPCVCVQTSYIIKICMLEKVGTETEILLNWESIILIMGVNILTLIYIGIIYGRYFVKLQQCMASMLLIAMIATQGFLYIIWPEKIANNFICEVINAGNKYWGWTVWILLIVLIIGIAIDNKIDNMEKLWIGYLLYYFILCAGRSYDLRIGFTDSYARMMVTAIPIAYYAFVIKVKNYKLKNLEI